MIKKNNYFSAKILLIGDSKVGKSSIISMYVDNKFNESQPSTFGINFKTKTINNKNELNPINLNFWDSSGLDHYKIMINSYYYRTHGLIFTFSLNNR